MRAQLVSDAAIAAIADRLDILAAVRTAFVAATEEACLSAPVLRFAGHGGGGSFKFAAHTRLTGGKLGTYWANNVARGLDNHAATTLLLDTETGLLRAIVSARLLNRLRTAAGNAVATDLLANADSGVLAVVGGGGQAPFEARAIAGVRNIREIRLGLRDPARGAPALSALQGVAPSIRALPIEAAVRGADIVVTATSSRSPVLQSEWIGAGTHISAMGADAVGKQELDPALLARGRLFADLVSQARQIGEFQHWHGPVEAITPIGVALNGAHARTSRGDVTIFDSSGLAIQDLFAAQAALDLALEMGLVTEIDL